MKENLREIKTKKLLSEALLKLLEETPFENIKLIDICNEALVHKTTFYNHFEDKYDLLNYTIKQSLETIKSEIKNKDNIVDYYISMAREYLKAIKANPKFYISVLNSDKNGFCLYIFQNLFVEDIKNEVHNNNIPCPIPVNYIAKFYVTAVLQLVNEWVLTGMKESEEELIRYIEFLIRGKYTTSY